MDNATIQAKIQKGWTPNRYLTNMSMAYFQDSPFVARSIFPMCPVQLSSSHFYTFSKGDLARDNVGRKPSHGKVATAVLGHLDNMYSCKVDQVIVGIDQIDTLNYTRTGAPGMIDPRRAKTRFIAEQMNLHLDAMFAKNFFSTGVWENEKTGVTGTPGANQFYKFNDANFDAVNFFDDLKREMKREARRAPNVLALGVEAFQALKNNPDIIERVKFSGSTVNPAIVNENVLAQLFGIDRIVVLDSTYNAASEGNAPDMQYICDAKGALLCYVTPSPQIDTPSAGYIFTWDMLGNGSYIATDQYEGEPGTHTEFIEGLLSVDMKVCAQDMAVYLSECC